MVIEIPFSEACERNKDPILDVISPYLKQVSSVLEIGSGTAQHAVYFAKHFPELRWHTSDQAEYLPGIKSQLTNAQVANVVSPFELDVSVTPWCDDDVRYSAVFSANTLHIMNEENVEHFFAGLSAVTTEDAYLMVYGPFKFDGKFTSQSNADFDARLRSRGVGSGVRDFEKINTLAERSGFVLLEQCNMPANNQCIVWQRNA